MRTQESITNNDSGLMDVLNKAIADKDRTTLRQLNECAIQFFMKPEKIARKLEEAKIQATTVTTDLSQPATAAWSIFLEQVQTDLNWQKAFDVVTLGENENSWEIHNVSNGLTFKKMAEGERLNITGFSGTRATIYVEKRGGALGVTDEVKRFRKVYQLIQLAKTWRNKYWQNKRDEHYQLIAAAAPAGGTRVTTYQGAVTDTRASRVLATINSGAATLGNRNKDKGYDGINSYVLYLPETMKITGSEIEKLLNSSTVVMSNTQAGTLNLTYPVDWNYTWSSFVPANTGFLVLPGNKIQRADVVEPFPLEDEDILTLVSWLAVWTYYGAGIGDVDQVQRLLFA